MWSCRKCNAAGEESRRICPACGSIIEDVSAGMSVSESEHVDETQVSPMPVPLATDSAEPDADLDSGMGEQLPSSKEPSARSDWRCNNCGEIVPGSFDMCWKCLCNRAGQRTPDTPQPVYEADESDKGIEPENLDSDADLFEPTDQGINAQFACPRCGSTKIMCDVIVEALCDGGGILRAIVEGNPDALFLKNRLHGDVRSDICGRCGHVMFRVINPSELYDHYLTAHKPDDLASSGKLGAVPCSRCGILVDEFAATCPHCGGSHE